MNAQNNLELFEDGNLI
jgi:pseudomonalisin